MQHHKQDPYAWRKLNILRRKGLQSVKKEHAKSVFPPVWPKKEEALKITLQQLQQYISNTPEFEAAASHANNPEVLRNTLNAYWKKLPLGEARKTEIHNLLQWLEEEIAHWEEKAHKINTLKIRLTKETTKLKGLAQLADTLFKKLSRKETKKHSDTIDQTVKLMEVPKSYFQDWSTLVQHLLDTEYYEEKKNPAASTKESDKGQEDREEETRQRHHERTDETSALTAAAYEDKNPEALEELGYEKHAKPEEYQEEESIIQQEEDLELVENTALTEDVNWVENENVAQQVLNDPQHSVAQRSGNNTSILPNSIDIPVQGAPSRTYPVTKAPAQVTPLEALQGTKVEVPWHAFTAPDTFLGKAEDPNLAGEIATLSASQISDITPEKNRSLQEISPEKSEVTNHKASSLPASWHAFMTTENTDTSKQKDSLKIKKKEASKKGSCGHAHCTCSSSNGGRKRRS